MNARRTVHQFCDNPLPEPIPGLYSLFSSRSEIWQASRQQRCRDACQISEWYNPYYTQSRGLETSQDLAVRRLTFWRMDAWDVTSVKFGSKYNSFPPGKHIGNTVSKLTAIMRRSSWVKSCLLSRNPKNDGIHVYLHFDVWCRGHLTRPSQTAVDVCDLGGVSKTHISS